MNIVPSIILIKIKNRKENTETEKKSIDQIKSKKTTIAVISLLALFIIVCAALIITRISFNVNVYDKLCERDYKYEDDNLIISVNKDVDSDNPVLSVVNKKESDKKEYIITDQDDESSKYSIKFYILQNRNDSENRISVTIRSFFGGKIEIRFAVLVNEPDLRFLDDEVFLLTPAEKAVAGSVS